MNFTPINDDHAIEAIAFRILLNRAISRKDIQTLLDAHGAITSSVPAINISDDPLALEFSYYRPDGTSVWLLRFLKNEILVECTRYTRWQKIWNDASKLLRHSCNVLSESTPDIKFIAASITVIDKFIDETGQGKVAEVLQPAEFVAPLAFTSKTAWHSNVGWFEDYEQNPVLNNMNIQLQGNTALVGTAGTAPAPQILSIEHYIQIRLKPGEEVKKISTGHWLDKSMAFMHSRNKKCLGELLTKELQEAIKLNVKEATT